MRQRSSIIAALVLVLLFFGATVVTQRQAERIDVLAQTLETHAIPSIDTLTATTRHLHRFMLVVRSSLAAVAQRQPYEPGDLDEATRRLDASLAAFLATPPYPDELALRAELTSAVEELTRTSRALILGLRPGAATRADQVLVSEISPRAERVDERLARLILFNTAEATETGRAIQRARVRATQLSLLLHGLAAFVAAAVLWALVRELRDHAALVEARARLESERKQIAERRAAELDRFAARVAHDLKNPINTVALSVTLARERADDPSAVRSSLERASKGVMRTRQIIDGLLDFARSAGESRGEAALAPVVRSVVAETAAQAERAGVDVEVEPIGAIRVACAEAPLHSVLANLVGNAIKYVVEAPRRPHRVKVRAIDDDARVRVEIEDTGPGIAPELQPQIFDPFVRSHDARQPGHGVGLATVRQIVEACGGAVGVRSQRGQGTTFWFELPRA
jgi:signal transduction histidine kinase